MSKAAQKSNNKLAVLCLILLFIATVIAFSVISTKVHLHYSLIIRIFLNNLFPVTLTAPFAAAFACWLLSFSVRITPPINRALFLIAAILQLIVFLFWFLDRVPPYKVSTAAIIHVSILLAFWLSSCLNAYFLLAHHMRQPLPPLLRWITKRRLIIGNIAILMIFLSYLIYPQAYFTYQKARGYLGIAEAQLWLGDKYIYPYHRRLLIEETKYTNRDHFKAHAWYMRAAAQGERTAYLELAKLYFGVKDYHGLRLQDDKAMKDWENELSAEKTLYWINRAEAAEYKTVEGNMMKYNIANGYVPEIKKLPAPSTTVIHKSNGEIPLIPNE